MRSRLALVLVLATSPAVAEPAVEVQIRARAPVGAAAPTLEATVHGGPILPLDRYRLVQPSSRIGIAATARHAYAEGDEPIAIAVVINGQEIYVGNEDIEPDDSPARFVGILKPLEAALAKAPLATFGPKGSLGTIISYGDQAVVKLPMGPLTNLTAEAFGSQRDYYRRTGTALVSGIELALSELHRVETPLKALVVIGDGNDTNNDAAKAQLAQLKKQAAVERVQTFAIIYKGQLSEPGHVITQMIPNPKIVNGSGDIESALRAIEERVSDRYYLTFPGDALDWDGKMYDLRLDIDGKPTEPVGVTLAPKWHRPLEPAAPPVAGRHGCAGCATSGDASAGLLVLAFAAIVRRKRAC